MRITDLLKPEAVAIGASASTRDEVIDQLVALHAATWVTAVIGNPVMWLVACLVGSIVGCLILSLWKKPLKSE